MCADSAHGGPEGDRTLGLCVANAALSQLSYEPGIMINCRLVPRKTQALF